MKMRVRSAGGEGCGYSERGRALTGAAIITSKSKCKQASPCPRRHAETTMSQSSESLVDVVHEDEELLVLAKPPGLVCHPTKADALSSLAGRVRLHLGDGSSVHFVNRLDRETSGLVLLAKTSGAARALGKLMESRAIQKEYLAVVHDHVDGDEARVDAPLGRDESSPIAIRGCVRTDGAPASTAFRIERRFGNGRGPFSLLRVWPLTGRKHQIRIHLAHLGHPLVGDKLYGLDPSCYLAFVERRLTEEQCATLVLPWHALHAERLAFTWKGRDLAFSTPRPDWWGAFLDHGEAPEWGDSPT